MAASTETFMEGLHWICTNREAGIMRVFTLIGLKIVVYYC